MTETWEEQLAWLFGRQARLGMPTKRLRWWHVERWLDDEQTYHYARIAGHFGRIALGQTAPNRIEYER
jgi:hypothetical protein